MVSERIGNEVLYKGLKDDSLDISDTNLQDESTGPHIFKTNKMIERKH